MLALLVEGVEGVGGRGGLKGSRRRRERKGGGGKERGGGGYHMNCFRVKLENNPSPPSPSKKR